MLYHRPKLSTVASETQKKRLILRRMEIVYGILLVSLLIIIARLLELQIVDGAEYEEVAHAQHYGGIVLPAKRGEILSRNSKTNEVNLLATNTTLDLLYVDPFVTGNEHVLAEFLSETLLTAVQDSLCRTGNEECPREFREYYEQAFEAVPSSEPLPSFEDIRHAFSRDTERRISEEYASFIPLLYGATKQQMQTIEKYSIPGIEVSKEQNLIYANPIHVPTLERRRIAKVLSPVLGLDQELIADKIRKRRLRYVPIMRRLPPQLSKLIREKKEESALKAAEERESFLAAKNTDAADHVTDPLRGIALIPEHWRLYPDGTLAAQTIGFLSINQKAQSGIERTFDHELRGQEGRIQALTDPFGGQVVSDDQTIVNARDGKSVVLTIDRYLQKRVEEMLQEAVQKYEADSGQVLIMDPYTGKILVMANAPLFDSNDYSMVFRKTPIEIPEDRQSSIVVEIADPASNELVIRAYHSDLTPEGRVLLSEELRGKLHAVEVNFDLDDLKRYYLYTGENSRHEIFPQWNDDGKLQWLQYENRIGVGAYINRTMQTIYEPGSVFKAITMAAALDQEEVKTTDTYLDEGPVNVDEYVIENAEHRHFGEVSMTDCLSFSVNTCMTSVSQKLGKKLFAHYIERFGFGRITGIQFEDEQPGQMLNWRRWSDALLATASYGQGISTTPLQIIAAYAALANGGRLVKPSIIDSWISPDGREEPVHPVILDQVITEEAAATVTAMLVNGMNEGFARHAKVKGYRMAGKTGTSQIAGPGGKYEKSGSGSTIATFAGYAPIDKPKFVMLIKFDRPRTDEWGSRSAAPLFRNISALLFEYYGIPPDEL